MADGIGRSTHGLPACHGPFQSAAGGPVCVDHYDISSGLRCFALHVHSIAMLVELNGSKTECDCHCHPIYPISTCESIFFLPDVSAMTRGGQCQPQGASRGIMDFRLHEACSVPIFRELCRLCMWIFPSIKPTTLSHYGL